MDELKIGSKLLGGTVEKIAAGVLKKKLGCETKIYLHDLSVTNKDGSAHAHLDLDICMEEEELKKLLGKLIKGET